MLGDPKYEFASSTHKTKGCYGYHEGTYEDSIYYGTGGTKEQASKTLAHPQYRPPGYDCTPLDSIGNLLVNVIKRKIQFNNN